MNTAPGDVTGTAFDGLPTGIAIIDGADRFVYANAAFTQRLNVATLPRSISDIPARTPALLALLDRHMRDVGESAVSLEIEPDRSITLYIGARRGGDRRVIVAATGWPGLSDTATGLVARLDPLTGFGNRLMYDERIRALEQTPQGAMAAAVIAVDLDRFKQVNDTLGHVAGDELLGLAAQRIRASTRGDDTLTRLGGDEFAILLTRGVQMESVCAIAARLVSLISRPFLIDGHQVNIGASVGIAMLGHGSERLEDLLKHADLALYEAKAQGRSRYAVFEPRLEQRAQERRAMELDLRRALGLRQFSLFYQPQTSIADRRISGFEALIRWDHPARGRVSPADFIPLAEELGEIRAIGEWVIRSACQEAMRWADPTLSVAVNVSPAQFENDDIVAIIRKALSSSGLAPERLEIEITEGLLLGESEEVMRRLWALKELGVAIAMDDFGTGYASLSYLHSFPFSKIKIDKSFIQAAESPRSRALVSSILSMGASLGMVTIAEGVETLQQYRDIAQGGCGIAQGYYIARPMPAQDIAGFINSFNLTDMLALQEMEGLS